MLTTTFYTWGSVTLKIRSRSSILELFLEANKKRFIICPNLGTVTKTLQSYVDHNILHFQGSVTLKIRSRSPIFETFLTISVKFSTIQYHISQNWKEGFCTVPDGILIKYHIKVHCKLKQKMYVCHTNWQNLHFQNFRKSFFIEM